MSPFNAPDRHAHTDLARALLHVIRQRPIQAHRDEPKRRRHEKVHQAGHGALALRGLAHDLAHRPHFLQRQLK